MPSISALDAAGATQTVQTLPAVGQAASAASLPVVIASDQTSVSVQGATADGSTPSTPSVRVGGVDSGGLKRTLLVDVTGLPGRCIPYNDTSTALTGSGGATPSFTGTSRDSQATSAGLSGLAYFNGLFYADQAGTAYLDASWDNSTWTPVASSSVAASTALTLQVPLMFRYHRVRFSNTSASAQTTFRVASSYTAA